MNEERQPEGTEAEEGGETQTARMREALLKEVENVRVYAQQSTKIRPRAYENIEEMLLEAVSSLQQGDTV